MSDPLMSIGPDGASIQFIGGGPVMDEGLQNLAFISLFTAPGWCGNSLLRDPIGSDFEEACKKPITLRGLVDVRDAALRALKDPAFGAVTVTVTNPLSWRLRVVILIEPPNGPPTTLELLRDHGVWSFGV